MNASIILSSPSVKDGKTEHQMGMSPVINDFFNYRIHPL